MSQDIHTFSQMQDSIPSQTKSFKRYTDCQTRNKTKENRGVRRILGAKNLKIQKIQKNLKNAEKFLKNSINTKKIN
jgi:hypothetical protein